VKVVVDAGGLIAAERDNPHLTEFRRQYLAVTWIVPTCVVAQVWRDGRQAQLARFLKTCDIVGVRHDAGKRLGRLLGTSDTYDVVDATVVDLAREREAGIIVTSDPGDMTKLLKAAKLSVELLAV
jgi:hypothetical protein